MAYYQNRPKTKIERIRDAVENIDENGLGMAAVGTTVGTDTTLDKKWQEIYDAFSSGVSVVISIDNGEEESDITAVVSAYISSGSYCIKDANGDVYTATSATGYPVHSA